MSATTCCLCRGKGTRQFFERTNLPGTGWRCIDHVGCKRRVRKIVANHKALASMVEDHD